MTELVPLKDCPPGLFWFHEAMYLNPQHSEAVRRGEIARGEMTVYRVHHGLPEVLPVLFWVEPTRVQNYLCGDTCLAALVNSSTPPEPSD